MMSTSSKQLFFLTEKAAQHITKILMKEPAGFFFRLAVSGGGCNGFQYNFTIDDTRSNDDVSFAAYNAEIIIDQSSLGFLEGSTLEYKEELIGSSFQITNPKAGAGCGCGNSFSI